MTSLTAEGSNDLKTWTILYRSNTADIEKWKGTSEIVVPLGAVSNSGTQTAAFELAEPEIETAAKVYPNPSNGTNITVVLSGDQERNSGEIRVYDVSGNFVYAMNIDGSSNTYTLQTSLKPGLYVVKVKQGKSLQNIKLIVE